MSRISAFGAEVITISEKFNIELLKHYGETISDYANSFDTVGVEGELEKLDNAIGKLNKLWSESNGNEEKAHFDCR